MILRPHRRDLVVWRQSASPAGWHGAPRFTRARRIRRWIRTGVLLTLLGLTPLARAVRARWRILLPGVAFTVAGVLLRGGAGGVFLLPGLLFLLSAPLIPASPDADRAELERELAGYSTPAQRRDLEAMLDQYPDGDTGELREILARQAMAGYGSPLPGGGRY